MVQHPDPEALAADLRRHLLKKFAGKSLARGDEPRAENVVDPREVQDTVHRFLADLDDGQPLRSRVVTMYSAAQARAAGQPVPAEVPDEALLEVAGVDVDIDPADPTRINMRPQSPAWVWGTATFMQERAK